MNSEKIRAIPPRLRQSDLRKLYQAFRRGLYDEDMIREVGWGLFTIAEHMLMMSKTVRLGEVPCLRCGQIVQRKRLKFTLPKPTFPCSSCQAKITWPECLWVYTDSPHCLHCLRPVMREYTHDRLTCSSCNRTWSWQSYKQALHRRKELPCPKCRKMVRQPESQEYEDQLRHYFGQLRSEPRLKSERLYCSSCDYHFTWQTWRSYHKRHPNTNNMPALATYVSQWPKLRSPERQMIQIDSLVHAMHGTGIVARGLIEGSEESILALLDEIAMWQ